MPTESDAPASTGETVETGEPVEAKEVPEPRTPAQLPSAHMPIIPELPMEKPPLSVDADKLARSWQVGRAKLLSVCRSLQFPFADGREFQFPVPLRSYVPSLDRLSPGKMLSALVIGIADFGVFVELGPDCSGLIHISQLGPAFVEDPHQFVQVGDVIPVWVLSTDEKKKRVALTALPPGSARESNSREPAERDTRPQQDRRKPFQQQQGSGDGKSTSRERYGNRDSKPGHSGARDGGRSSGGNRPQRDRGQQPNRRDRNTSESSQAEAREERAKRPVKIERPAIEKPLTEGMQTGKEPLRSFSDLMQFIKQGNKPASSDEQTRPVSPPPTEEIGRAHV